MRSKRRNSNSILRKLSPDERASVVYHNVFEYPLTVAELKIWRLYKDKHAIDYKKARFHTKEGFIFLQGKESLLKKREQNEQSSHIKLSKAKKAAVILSKIPTISAVFITGSLAMRNASWDSDIDLLIITRRQTLWSTRLFTLTLLRLLNMGIRRSGKSYQKDLLCLNMWLEESHLSWKVRNMYTAHEICQLVLLYDRGFGKRFLIRNRWASDYWPFAYNRALSKKTMVSSIPSKGHIVGNLLQIFNSLAFTFQKFYMRSKITNEKITKTYAFFHPQDLSRSILERLKNEEFSS